MTLADTRATLEAIDVALDALSAAPFTWPRDQEMQTIIDKLEALDARIAAKLRSMELAATTK
jgi:hypothetical protein